VKPAGCSLNVVAVGLGQAGGNLAAEFFRRGYRALALNTAQTDLSALGETSPALSLPSSQRLYIGIDGYDGAGCDPNYGRQCLELHADRIRNAIAEHTEGADVVVVTAGLGGGTGSTVAELMQMLRELSLPLVCLTTVPSHYESGIKKVNAVRSINELVATPGLGCIFVDNSRLAQSHKDASLNRYYERINQFVLEPLDALNRLNDREEIHAIRTLDGEDFRTLLLSGGVLNYAVVPLSKLTVGTAMECIRDALHKSAIMPPGFSLAKLSSLGLVIEASERTLSDTSFTFSEQLHEQLKNESGGAAITMGLYRVSQPEGTAATLRLLCSCRSLPEGLREVVTEAQREGSLIQDKLQQGLKALELGEVETFEFFGTNLRSGSLSGRRPRLERAQAARAPRTPARPMVAETPPQEAPLPPVRPAHTTAPVATDIPLRAQPVSEARSKTTTRRYVESPSVEEDVTLIAKAPAARIMESGVTQPSPASSGERWITESEPAAPEWEPEEPAFEPVAEAGAEAAEAWTSEPEVEAEEVPEPVEQPKIQKFATAEEAITSEEERQFYTKLAREFRKTRSDEKRTQIARQLENDVRSERSIIRYYAVKAMAQINHKMFEGSLTRALKDANPHVQKRAREALDRLQRSA